MASILTITIPRPSYKYPELHRKGTLVCKLKGPGGTAKGTLDYITSMLIGPFGIPQKDIIDLYRYDNPTQWFFKLSEEAHKKMYHGLHDKFRKINPDLKVTIEHLEPDKKKLYLSFLPRYIDEKGVKEVVTELTGDPNPSVYVSQKEFNKWGATCCPSKEISHHFRLYTPGVTGAYHKVLVQVPGRRIACEYCEKDDHWTNKCPSKPQKGQRRNDISVEDFPLPTKEIPPTNVIPETPVATNQTERFETTAKNPRNETTGNSFQKVPPRKTRRHSDGEISSENSPTRRQLSKKEKIQGAEPITNRDHNSGKLNKEHSQDNSRDQEMNQIKNPSNEEINLEDINNQQFQNEKHDQETDLYKDRLIIDEDTNDSRDIFSDEESNKEERSIERGDLSLSDSSTASTDGTMETETTINESNAETQDEQKGAM